MAVSNVALVLLVAVLASAVVYGLLPSLVAGLICALAYNFFFLPPLYTFTIADPENVVTLLVFMLVAFVFYMAIDAMRVAKARQTGEALADPFESWSKHRPLGPIILISVGALFLLNNFGFFDFFRVRQFFWPLVLIGIGVLMLRNRVGGQS